MIGILDYDLISFLRKSGAEPFMSWMGVAKRSLPARGYTCLGV
jgi:hypothetical protein